jgi:hypothetical protein
MSSSVIPKISNFPCVWKVWTCSHGSSDPHRTLGKSSPESAWLKHHHSCLRPARDVTTGNADIELSRYRKAASVASCLVILRARCCKLLFKMRSMSAHGWQKPRICLLFLVSLQISHSLRLLLLRLFALRYARPCHRHAPFRLSPPIPAQRRTGAPRSQRPVSKLYQQMRCNSRNFPWHRQPECRSV